MKPYRIVVDTNVLIASLRSQRGASYQLLTMLNDNRWQLNVSTILMFEYEEVLKRERIKLGLQLEDIDDLIDGICMIANKRNIFYLWRPVASDPDDDFLIDLAVESQADFIISYNQRDLQEVKRFGVAALTPKEFLQRVRRNRVIELTAQVPDSLYKQVEALATREKISVDQLVAIALSAQVLAWMTKDYLAERANRGNWERFQQVLAKVPNVEPEDYDKL